MKTQHTPKVVFAERLDGGVVVTFEDGKSILYSTELLLETAEHATDITALADDALL